ncbi:hypothetical protein [Comamonas sp. C11]|nr:hypothetical protein [Comamonas sp. C11]UUC96729.1 hypothetical protein NOX35_28500 [Comamonas sp. C11]
MKATGQFFAFAVCQTWDAKSWEVNTKQGNIYCALDERFSTKEEAHAAGAAWLEKQEK